MVGALVDQVNPVTMLEKYPALAAVAKNNIQTDIAQDELPAFVELVQRMQKGSITSLALTNKNTNVGNPDYAKIHALVQSAIATPQPAPSHPATATPTTPTADADPVRHLHRGAGDRRPGQHQGRLLSPEVSGPARGARPGPGEPAPARVAASPWPRSR